MQRTSLLAGTALATLLGLALAARRADAQATDATDVLVLTDGTTLRGHVTEIHPGRDTTLVLLDGQARVVPAGDIASATGPAYPGGATQPLAPLAVLGGAPFATPYLGGTIAGDPDAAVAALRHPGPGRVPLRIESPGGRQLVSTEVPLITMRGIALTGARDVCFAPCTLYVAPGVRRLVVGGEGYQYAVNSVDVPDEGLRVTMHARPSGIAGAVFALDLLGALALSAGVPLVVVAAAESRNAQREPLFEAGGATMAAGGLALVVGIVVDLSHPAGIASMGPLDAPARARNAAPAVAVAPMAARDGAGVLVGGAF